MMADYPDKIRKNLVRIEEIDEWLVKVAKDYDHDTFTSLIMETDDKGLLEELEGALRELESLWQDIGLKGIETARVNNIFATKTREEWGRHE